MKVSAIEPMVISEDLEMEKALESARKSKLKAERISPVETSSENTKVASEQNRQLDKEKLIQLSRELTHSLRKRKQKKPKKKTRSQAVLERYASLSLWEESEDCLGLTMNKIA